jgi:DNA ligase (NAD+)
VPVVAEVPESLTEARARHDQLTRTVRDARYRYYVLSDPTPTDAEFAAHWHGLLAIAAAHPSLVTASSPTPQVGAPVDSAFPPFRHLQPMRSLDNAFSREELVRLELEPVWRYWFGKLGYIKPQK